VLLFSWCGCLWGPVLSSWDRQLGCGLMEKAEVIPYGVLKNVIVSCSDKRTQALMAFQYGMANRVGEIAKKYRHKKQRRVKKTGKMVLLGTFWTAGIKREQFVETKDGLEWESPNFKNAKNKYKRAWILKREKWLYDILKARLEEREGEEFLFEIGVSRCRQLVDKELKKHKPEWRSHCLRHSRATHIADLTGDPFVVKEVLGHARLETSARYINIAKARLKEKLGVRSFEEVLGEKV